jgi:transcription-repair coupling factor (superfamily II helicase)
VNTSELLKIYSDGSKSQQIANWIKQTEHGKLVISGIVGSLVSFEIAGIQQLTKYHFLILMQDKEKAAYIFNDIESLLGEQDYPFHEKQVLFFPSSSNKSNHPAHIDNTNLLLRTESLKRLKSGKRKSIIVSYPEAIAEKVVNRKQLEKFTFRIKKNEQVSFDFFTDLLIEYHFERTDFVIEPGQFALRGGIIDVFSYNNDLPYRISFFGDQVDSIRTFHPADQISIDELAHITIVPDIRKESSLKDQQSFIDFLPDNTSIWIDNLNVSSEIIADLYQNIQTLSLDDDENKENQYTGSFIDHDDFIQSLAKRPVILFGKGNIQQETPTIEYRSEHQPAFNKNFELLLADLKKNKENGYSNLILSNNQKQLNRLNQIFDDLAVNDQAVENISLFQSLKLSIHQGFIDHNRKIAVYTDHQIFDRYHRFRINKAYSVKESLSIKELYKLNKGDFVTHIDYGIGVFDGLEKIENNGKIQEAIRLIYKDRDLLYVSIHSLHRISKYVSKEGTPPKLHKLGTSTWKLLKNKAKSKVKDIARDLIKLYAKRRASKGFAFSPDSYLQHELEASFIYEDTPDQIKSTQDVKNDMEASYPMDRLICGDVGFGKTEVAIRAAFKAVNDSKQVAILVPTTILALQHYYTFSERLEEFPCNVEYINRFRSRKKQTEIIKKIKEGKIDIIIGTHRLIGKDIEFKDLGLLVVDEEQKFGVSTKEKLKHLRVNVDTLTMTATPIPRTLQFSLMGARDLSIINTPPPNRFPVLTELQGFGEEVIANAINYEMSRGGQVFFVHNRVQNIMDVADMIQKFCPKAHIAIGHGQMEGKKLEQIMIDFIEGEYDVLLSTTIIESGLDIPNANTIIINNAQNFGLSDLHQLRGRVGRTNKKAFCYLLTPPLSTLPNEARKRLQAIEEYTQLGSGFNIAMRDLDIRGAGNLLGGEQSGFISDIGFEMYQKILDEAIQELRETETNQSKESYPERFNMRKCQLESDLSLMIPDNYVVNIEERLSLYKKLDEIDNEKDLVQFKNQLLDRFGQIPQPTEELLQSIKLRWMAGKIGFTKMILKNNSMLTNFISDPESSYYQSKEFAAIIQFVKTNPQLCSIKETKEKLSLRIREIPDIQKALQVISQINGS